MTPVGAARQCETQAPLTSARPPAFSSGIAVRASGCPLEGGRPARVRSPSRARPPRPLAAALARAAVVAALAGAVAHADGFSSAIYSRAAIAPVKTSIYVGNVLLSVDTLSRSGSTYVSRYSAKVFPYFFWNETGRLRIDVPDAALRRLHDGQPIDFTGEAIRDDGRTRTLTGRAVPTGPAAGQIKVRIFVTTRISLVFNTTYQVIPAASAPR